jgi:hypothetical protein
MINFKTKLVAVREEGFRNLAELVGGERSMVNGEWSMVNGEWSMVNGQW